MFRPCRASAPTFSRLLAAGLVLALLPAALRAQAAEPVPVPAAPPAAERVAPDSPRAALESYFDQCRAGRFDQAARWLELPEGTPPGEGTRLARRLKLVLDHELWVDLSQVSGAAVGDEADGLLPETEELGTLRSKSGVEEPVRLVRLQDADGSRWVFSAATVGRVDHWYGRLPDRWIVEHLPPALLRAGPFGILYWQWIALPAALLGAWFAGWSLARASRGFLARLAARTTVTWDDAVLARIGGPLTLTWLIAVLHVLLPLVGLALPIEDFSRQALRAGLFFAFFWALMRAVDVAVQVLRESQWTAEHPAAHSLIPLGGRVLKVLVLALAFVSALSELGFPVTSLIAGLGIGGLALALAAQKTVENLVGAFSIGVDQPMKVGDFVRIGEHLGTVEQIGLRSTRLRTLDRTLITIPNAQVSEQRVETYAARDRIRFNTTIGLEYGTSAAQLREVLAGFERELRAHPRTWQDTVVVRFVNFGAYSLDIEVMAWFSTTDFNEFRACREEVLFAFMQVVERAGAAFAFPTQTLHLVKAGEAPARG